MTAQRAKRFSRKAGLLPIIGIVGSMCLLFSQDLAAAPVTVQPGSPMTYSVFYRLTTASGKITPPGGQAVTVPAPTQCSSQALSWTVGSTTCQAPSGTSNSGALSVSSTNGNLGTGNFVCAPATNTYALGSGSTCAPPGCPAQTVSWTVSGASCTGNIAQLGSGQSATVSATNAPNMGAATYTCTAGSLNVASASCATPPPAPPASVVQQIESTNNFFTACFLLSTGGVKCAGTNQYGELGRGSADYNGGQGPSYPAYPTPDYVKGMTSGIKAISGSWGGFCALNTSGRVLCWGINRSNQLNCPGCSDVNGVAMKANPVDVGLSNISLISSAGPTEHSCAVSATGAIYCWGENLGLTSILAAGNSVSGISTGYNNNCAIINGAMKCWWWELGLGGHQSLTPSSPVQIPGFTNNVVSIKTGSNSLYSLGYSYTCGIFSDGTMKCQSQKPVSFFGTPRSISAPQPGIAVTGVTDASSFLGGNDVCFKTKSNRYFCVTATSSNYTIPTSYIATEVFSKSGLDLQYISGEGGRYGIDTSTGNLFAWCPSADGSTAPCNGNGGNTNGGSLGIGSTNSYPTPTRVLIP